MIWNIKYLNLNCEEKIIELSKIHHIKLSILYFNIKNGNVLIIY